MRVVRSGRGQRGHVGIEILFAAGAIVFGIGDDHLAGPRQAEVPQIMQRTGGGSIAVATVSTPRAGPPPIMATAADDFRGGQLFDGGDPLREIRRIFSWSQYSLLEVMSFTIGPGIVRMDTLAVSS